MTTRGSINSALRAPTLSSKRNSSLDGLRGLAVCLVVIFHVYPLALTGGFLAVDVFFVLSGFLITGLLLQEQEQTGRINLRFFYARRALRLFPALLLMILLLVPAYWLFAKPKLAHQFTTEAFFALTYTTNWVAALDLHSVTLLRHTWSLAIEEQFYLLWPPMLIAITRGRPTLKSLMYISISLWLISIATRVYLSASGSSIDRLYNGLDTRADAIMAGAITALVHHRQSNKPTGNLPMLLAWSHIPALAVLGYFFWSASYLDKALYYWQLPLVHAGAAIIILHLCLHKTGSLYRLLCTPPMRQLGEISYGIYLWHFPVLLLGLKFNIQPQFLLVFTLLGTISTAYLSWRFIEKPCLAAKGRLHSSNAHKAYEF